MLNPMSQSLSDLNDGDKTPGCLVTRLTPERRGAVAVIAVEGPAATECVGRHFVPAAGKPLDRFPLHRIVFGRWQPGEGPGEEVVVCRRSDDRIEVNCHGGVAAARAIIAAMVSGGAVEQPPAAWVHQHAAGSLEAEAWLALSFARTERVAAILLDQYRGALRDAVQTTIEDLSQDRLAAAQSRLRRLSDVGHIGEHLIDPWRIVFAGPPNAGKSSLINRLLGYQRSIVFDQPGTTRDLLTATTAFDGWPVELVDTAGLRATDDAIEIEGVARAEEMLGRADITVLVFDATNEWGEPQEQLLNQESDSIALMNKHDLRPESSGPPQFLWTSALTGTGIEALIARIVARLAPLHLGDREAVPFTARQLDVIQLANKAVERRAHDEAITSLGMLVTGR
jgi:tRNA modification GTPase